MSRLRRIAAVLACCASCSSGGGGASPAPTAPVSAVQGSRHLPPVLARSVDLGRMASEAPLEGASLLFVPRGSRAERDGLLRALQDSASPLYHRWLTPEQYAARFGATPEDVGAATAWLEAHGFRVDGPTRARTRLRFSGTVGQLEQAFHTEMHRYRHAGVEHFGLTIEPEMPPELGAAVAGLRNVHDATPSPGAHPVPESQQGSTVELGPADWATVYDMGPLYARIPAIDGAGRTVAVVGGSTILQADVLQFRSMFGLSATTPQEILVPNSGTPGTGGPGYLGEASLDVEWAGAIAKNATVAYVYVGTASNYSIDDAIFYAFENDVAPIVSDSYGLCEQDYASVDADDYAWEGDLAAMLGITLVVATGDGAASACDEGYTAAIDGFGVSMPASVPGALAVGGTMLLPQPLSSYVDSSGNVIKYIPEIAWNETTPKRGIFGGVGGQSVLYPKPFWQTGPTPADGARDVPDLALASGLQILPYVVELQGASVGFGGTSCAAPSLAGAMTLVEQALAVPGLGNVGPILYGLAQGSQASAVFHDVVQGDNVVPCTPGTSACPSSAPYQFGFTAGAGYDRVTGNGSVDVAQLVGAWTQLAPTSTTLAAAATGMTEGSPLTLTATVASMAATPPMGGRVIFYYANRDAAGFPAAVGALGIVAVSPTGGATQGGTAQLATFAPPGLTGASTVSAFYSGDSAYLPSWSATAALTATSSFGVTPDAATTTELGTVQFGTTGGVAPVTWAFLANGSHGHIDALTGTYVAGSLGPAQDYVVATDRYGAQAVATVTVTSGKPDAGISDASADAPVDAQGAQDGSPDDASADGPTPVDASVSDAPGTEGGIVIPPSLPPSGCGCRIAGARTTSTTGAGIAALLALALGARGRGRRRSVRDRDPSSSDTSASATPRAPRRGSSPW